MACYVTTVGNCAAKMLNEISQEEDYLWDFLSLLRSLLKYQSTVISSKILWRLPQHLLSTFPHPQFCLSTLFLPTVKNLPLAPIIPKQSRLTYITVYSLQLGEKWKLSTQSWHGPRILAPPSKTCISPGLLYQYVVHRVFSISSNIMPCLSSHLQGTPDWPSCFPSCYPTIHFPTGNHDNWSDNLKMQTNSVPQCFSLRLPNTQDEHSNFESCLTKPYTT